MNLYNELLHACRIGDLSLACSLYEKYPDVWYFISTMDARDEMDDNLFVVSCENGQLHIVRWLLSIKSDINISEQNDYALRLACSNGHLDVVRWLLSIKPDINISTQDDCAFRWSCLTGKLDMATFLLSMKPDIDISVKDEYAFRWACRNGHLDTVRWLLSVKPDLNILAQEEFALKWSIRDTRWDVVKWLLQISLKTKKIFNTPTPDHLKKHSTYICIYNYPNRCTECYKNYKTLVANFITMDELCEEIANYIIY